MSLTKCQSILIRVVILGFLSFCKNVCQLPLVDPLDMVDQVLIAHVSELAERAFERPDALVQPLMVLQTLLVGEFLAASGTLELTLSSASPGTLP